MRSTERILTTHVGSLPRFEDLVELIWAKSDGKPFNEASLDERVKESIKEAVRKQREAGIDIVSDGELSKPGFSSYIYERYGGFGKPVEIVTNAEDLADFPEVA